MTPPKDATASLLGSPYATMIRDVAPSTPTGRAPKVAAGDPVEVTARLVRDGHGILAARVRWRCVDSTASRLRRRWRTAPMSVDDSGGARARIVVDEPGRHQFEVRAWRDRLATWRRDLRVRAEVDEPLDVEFLVGSLLLERLVDRVDEEHRGRLLDAVGTLSDDTCARHVRLAAALDDALAGITSEVEDPDDVTVSPRHPLRVDRELAVAGAWYEFFPRSEGGLAPGTGSWERLEAAAAAGFDVVYLPPVHPIGTTDRKGRDNTLVARPGDVGSPWAIGGPEGGHTAVHPDLGTVEDVAAFVARGRELGVEVAMDYALQCSPDHPWVTEHPEWFVHRPDGTIRYAENPPKKYQDIYPLEFWPPRDADRVALWEACRDVMEFWIGHGVSVFRVDNPHTKPLAFWEWLIRDVQDRHPEVVLLSEAFTDPTMMHALAEVGFSQSYTYFTWRTTKWELTAYGEELAHGPASGWFRPNLWPNTPDILAGPLRHGSRAAFASRAVLAATMAPSWGVYSGFELCENDPVPDREEYRRSEKYELVERDHTRDDSLWPLITRLNAVRHDHPCMRRMTSLRFHDVDHDDLVVYSHHRRVDGVDDSIVVVVSLRPDEVCEATVRLDLAALGRDPSAGVRVRDELTGERWDWGPGGNYVRLGPDERVAHVFALE